MTHMSPESTRAELRRADGSAIRVLVVDDEAGLAELLSMALRMERCARTTRTCRSCC